MTDPTGSLIEKICIGIQGWCAKVWTLSLALNACASLQGASTVVAWGDQAQVPPDWTNVVSVACSPAGVIAVRDDGTVSTCGDTNDFALRVPSDLTNVTAVSLGIFSGAALTRNGTVRAWGAFRLLTNVPAGLSEVMAIAMGASHCVALKSNGTLVAWGDNQYSQVRIPTDLTNVIAIAAGVTHSVALRSDGTVVAFGYNGSGQTNVPTGLSNVVSVAASGATSYAVRADGSVMAWGSNYYGQTNLPTDLTNVVAIAGGDILTIALRQNGTVTFWGPLFTPPILVPEGLTNVRSIAGKQTQFAALTASQRAIITQQPANVTAYDGTSATFSAAAGGDAPIHYQWWFEDEIIPDATNRLLLLTNVALADAGLYRAVASNPLGVATSAPAMLTVIEGPPVLSVQPSNCVTYRGGSAGFSVTADGSQPLFYQWYGRGQPLTGATNRELSRANLSEADTGDCHVVVSNLHGSATSSPVMLSVLRVAGWGDIVTLNDQLPASLTNVVALSAGSYCGFGLHADGRVTAWGASIGGTSPNPPELSNIVAVCAGEYHGLALLGDGTVAGWGRTTNNTGIGLDFGQARVPDGLSNVVAVAAGQWHSLALRGDGTVVAWGRNDAGQASVPADLTNIVAIAGGSFLSLALRSDGHVVSWGSMDRSALSDLTNVVAIDAGAFHALVLTRDGTVMALGWILGHGLATSPDITNAIAIAAGFSHGIALKGDSAVIAWGPSAAGETNVPPGLTNVVAIAAGGYQSLALIEDARPPLELRPPAVDRDKLVFTVPTRLGTAYRLEYCDLLDGAWTMLPPVPGDGTTKTLTTPMSSTSQRFFRLRIVR